MFSKFLRRQQLSKLKRKSVSSALFMHFRILGNIIACLRFMSDDIKSNPLVNKSTNLEGIKIVSRTSAPFVVGWAKGFLCLKTTW